MEIYANIDDLKKDCPGICEAILSENEAQYPKAIFISGRLGKYDNDDDMSLVVLFDVGTDELLYVTAGGELDCPVPHWESYIDEYYLMPANEAWELINLLK